MKNNKTEVLHSISMYAKFKNMADDTIILRIFGLVEQNSSISQRKIKIHTGLAAGLIHSFMKRIIEKGWIRANKVSAKRWLYFMTPEGFIEKSRLTMNYLGNTFQAYRITQDVIKAQLEVCGRQGCFRLIVVGAGELANILAMHIKSDESFKLVAIVSNSPADAVIHGVKVIPFGDVENLEFDKLLLCDHEFLLWRSEQGIRIDDAKIVDVVGLLPIPL